MKISEHMQTLDPQHHLLGWSVFECQCIEEELKLNKGCPLSPANFKYGPKSYYQQSF